MAKGKPSNQPKSDDKIKSVSVEKNGAFTAEFESGAKVTGKEPSVHIIDAGGNYVNQEISAGSLPDNFLSLDPDDLLEIINPDGSRSKPSECTIQSTVAKNATSDPDTSSVEEFDDKTEIKQLENALDKHVSESIVNDLSKSYGVDSKITIDINFDEFKKKFEKEWRDALDLGITEQLTILTSNALSMLSLKTLVSKLPYLARAAEKQGKYALSAEYHNLHNVAGQALNKLNELSEDALNFNPD